VKLMGGLELGVRVLSTILTGRCLTALEAGGARRLRNESFFSAPQLKRDPLGSTFLEKSCHLPELRVSPMVAGMAKCRMPIELAGPADERIALYLEGKHHPQQALLPRLPTSRRSATRSWIYRGH